VDHVGRIVLPAHELAETASVCGGAYGASGVNPGATAGLITFSSSTVQRRGDAEYGVGHGYAGPRGPGALGNPEPQA